MTCTKNINKFILPNDVILKLCEIYKYIGKNDKYQEIASSDYMRIISQTIERDTYFLSKLIDLDITDTRLRLIITKNSEARNRDEKVLHNIKEILTIFIQNPIKQQISASDLNNLINYIYPNQNIKYDVLKEEKKNIYHLVDVGSKREIVEELANFINSSESDNVEAITLYLNYLIDLYALKPFTLNNDCLFYVIMYLLLLKCDIGAIHYVSLFEAIYNHKEELNDSLNEAIYNYNEGIPQILSFIRFMTSLILKLYERTDNIISQYSTDANLAKADNIENTIMNLNNIFTKEEIRLNHPYVSESTINRVLLKLRDENIIRPLGKGRSAKWIKIGLK